MKRVLFFFRPFLSRFAEAGVGPDGPDRFSREKLCNFHDITVTDFGQRGPT